jgi:hypothetical protein
MDNPGMLPRTVHDVGWLQSCVIERYSFLFAIRLAVCWLLPSLHCQQMQHIATKYPTMRNTLAVHPVQYAASFTRTTYELLAKSSAIRCI